MTITPVRACTATLALAALAPLPSVGHDVISYSVRAEPVRHGFVLGPQESWTF